MADFVVSGNLGGIGSIDSDVYLPVDYVVSGYVYGSCSISSSVTEKSHTIIEGSVVGVGKVSYFLNNSKNKAYNPILIAEKTPYNVGDCPIVALEYQGFSPNKIINIISKENSKYENTVDYHKNEIIESNGTYFPIKHYPYHETYNNKLQYLVTDHNSNTQKGKPLYYQYELLYDAYSAISGVAVKNIYKNNEIKLDKDEYKIQYSYDTLVDGNRRYSSSTWGEINQTNVHRIRVLLPINLASRSDFYIIEYDKYINSVPSYQRELIELKPLYTPLDYTISGYLNESRLYLTEDTTISNTSVLNIIKDPNHRVNPLDIVTLKGNDLYASDRNTEWKLRLNLGAFYVPSGVYSNASGFLYNIEHFHSEDDDQIAITNIKPSLINSNIIQVKETPIFIDEDSYTYPLYKIEQYDKNIYTIYDQRGKFSININGTTRNDIKIKSIDKQKGFIELDTDLKATDEIELSFYISNSGFLLLENLELNPKINNQGSALSISDFSDGFGLAIMPWEGTDDSLYPYVYNLSTPTVGQQLPDVGYPVDLEETLPANTFTICEINLNKLTTDVVKFTDARKIGGGVSINSELETWFRTNYPGIFEHEPSWYSEKGYYDGSPLSHNSTIIIHVPDPIISGVRQNWIDYYKTNLDDYDQAEVVGDREFKFYLDQTIRRYISAGTDYIIVPTISGNVTGKFLNLR